MLKYLATAIVALALGAIGGYWAAQTGHEIEENLENKALITPAYMVVLGEVYDRDAFMEGYASKLGPLYQKYGGSYVAIGGVHEVLEGETGFKSHVISRWPGGVEDATAFWDSPEYAPLKQARIDNDWGRFDVFLVEGIPVNAATE